MPVESCIHNIGEFYSSHYLENTLAADCKETLRGWKNRGSDAPSRRLQALSVSYFAAKKEALEIRDPADRFNTGKDLPALHRRLLHALGYPLEEPKEILIEGGERFIPALARHNRFGKPWLVVLDGPFILPESSLREGEPSEDLLEMEFATGVSAESERKPFTGDWGKALQRILQEEDAPRWVMVLAGSQVYLIDQHKFAQGRYLLLDLDEAYGRAERGAFDTLAILLSAETLCPDSESDKVLHEKLDEGSHKFAYGVSEQLQGAVREAIELIVNDWVEGRRRQSLSYTRLRQHEALPDGSTEVTAEYLRKEALAFVYRLLFCFYAEARGGELDILPITEETYRLGYSLESLRDLEQVELTPATEGGGYFHVHLKHLFRLIYEGFRPDGDQMGIHEGLSRAFIIRPLTATLFSDESAPLLGRATLTNRCLQAVIRRLSLGADERSRSVGRINYAELGINQLGAVYEGLLSYRGMFADRNFIQVKSAKEEFTPKTPTWFVPEEEIEEYKDDEIIKVPGGTQPRIYTKGTFILHLNGIDRESSASYYTPESLTRAVVREALRELLKDFKPADADRILALKICEPAMGSAAFQNEATSQLADKYLELKQAQIGETIPPDRYRDEKLRVKHYLTTRNVYGVDLNPTAVELGALSLWLGSIHNLYLDSDSPADEARRVQGAVPWFGLRLRPGNSLIGSRRAVYTRQQLQQGKHFGNNAEPPRQLKPGEERGKEEIYHFLVFDPDMAPASGDKLMKSFWSDECSDASDWQKSEVKKKWSAQETTLALKICGEIDRHWKAYTADREKALRDTACLASAWPNEVLYDGKEVEGEALAIEGELLPGELKGAKTRLRNPSLSEQEKVKATLESDSGSFQRIKLIMDTWCTLWFWPIEENGSLPRRRAWLEVCSLVLAAEKLPESAQAMLENELGVPVSLIYATAQDERPDVDAISSAVKWMEVGRHIAGGQHFHHWELVFTEVLGFGKEARGFDLMLGNPPWLKVGWNDAVVLAELKPLLGVRDAKSATYNSERLPLLCGEEARHFYRDNLETSLGAATYLCSSTQYSELRGIQTNLYKNFIAKTWRLLAPEGVCGLLHPEGVYDDPNGGAFRSGYLPRLRAHYQFSNQYMLFGDIGHRNQYSINIYGAPQARISFLNITSLYLPQSIESCFQHANEEDPVLGLKTDDGHWNNRGHKRRIVTITEKELQLFQELFEDSETPFTESRIPQVNNTLILAVLKKFARCSRKLGDLDGEYFATEMFHEANTQRDGIITRQERPSYQPVSSDEWVISGPHFFAGTPFYKTPRTICTEKAHYDLIDLTEVPEDYLPRAVYRPGDDKGDKTKFHQAIAEWPRPSKPGFWPVAESDRLAYETLLGGEPLRFYHADRSKPGCSRARDFAFFSVWEGEVEKAVAWLKTHRGEETSGSFLDRFGDVKLKQESPANVQMKRLPLPITARPRFVNRRQCQPANERTLIPAIHPAGFSHIHPVVSTSFSDGGALVSFHSCTVSILYDFLMKISGRSDITTGVLGSLPLLRGLSHRALLRTLRLVCLTNHYTDLWQEVAPTLSAEVWSDYTDEALMPHRWTWETPLRVAQARRQALLEIDVLVAQALNLALEELLTIYRVQFPVMRQNELADEYDQKGRRLPNTTRKDAGGKELREVRKEACGGEENGQPAEPLTVSWEIDNGNQTVTKIFYPPFEHVDREEDYRVAWDRFRHRDPDSEATQPVPP